MKSFDDWFDELCNGNQIWAEQISMHHKPKTFEDCARKVYNKYLADEMFPPMQVARGYVGNVLGKVQPDKTYSKDWVTKALQKHEEKPEAPPLTGEARQQKLAEFKQMIDSAPKAFTTPAMSAKEIADEGGWIPKKDAPFVRSEIEQAEAYQTHKEKVDAARRKYFMSAYPDASELEIEAYVNKFDTI